MQYAPQPLLQAAHPSSEHAAHCVEARACGSSRLSLPSLPPTCPPPQLPIRRAHRALSPEARARLVFSQLDSDASGSISRAELGNLLVSWGLPRSEAVACLAEAERRWANARDRVPSPGGRRGAPAPAAEPAMAAGGADAARHGWAPGADAERSRPCDGYLDFAEFYEQLAPVWQFAAAIVDSHSGAEERVARQVRTTGRRLWGGDTSRAAAARAARRESDGT
jgi:hypothetical protein